MFDLRNDASLVVLAVLLSLLPVVTLFWIYYLREREPSVSGRTVTRFFAAGMLTVLPAVFLESGAHTLASEVSPVVASAFFTDFFFVRSLKDIVLAFFIAFGIVALVEEGFRFLFLRFLVRRSSELDQVVDGLHIGVASGIGFAFVENTLYFLRLLERLDFNTLAVVFFLRFLISTFGHISFGGVMGVELVRALAHPLERRVRLWRAFLIPWVLHGVFDFLLSIQLSAYTVLFLLFPLFSLWALYRSPQLYERFRLHGRMLRAPVRARPKELTAWQRLPVEALPTIPWCPTCLTALQGDAKSCGSCGTVFRWKGLSSSFAP